jgi:hypothetical protein
MWQSSRSLAAMAVATFGLLSCLLLVTPAEATTLFKHREATPQLPVDDDRLRRDGDAAAHDPEQVNIFENLCGDIVI